MCLGLELIGFDPAYRVVYSKLGRGLTFGDSDDFAKVILGAEGKPVVDIEVISTDAYSDYNLKLIGTKGTYKSTTLKYNMTYVADGENPEREVSETFIQDAEGNPAYCSEELVKHVEDGDFDGDAFSIGTPEFYRQLYYYITDGVQLDVTPEMAAEVISVIEAAHAENHLSIKF